MKILSKLFLLLSTFFFIFVFPLCAYAYSESVSFPHSNLPDFSSYVSSCKDYPIMIYNAADEKFYLIVTKSSYNYNPSYTASSGVFTLTKKVNYTDGYVYSCSSGAMGWTVETSANKSTSVTVCNYGSAGYRVVWIAGNVNINEDGTDLPFTNNQNETNRYFANYYNTLGEYIGPEDTGSDDSGSSGTVNVDLTQTNNILNLIASKVETVNTTVSDFKSTFVSNISSLSSTISGKITSLTSQVTTEFTNLKTYLTAKYNALYNVILYGSTTGESAIEEHELKLAETKEDLDSINESVFAVSDYMDETGQNVAEYITTFSDFYNNLATAAFGLTAIISFALIIIFIRKAVGR